MKLKELVSELQKKKSFNLFKKQNPDATFSAAFLILDLEHGANQIQLDFFLPPQKKIASFEFPFKEPKIHEDKIENMAPQSTKIKIDIGDLETTCNKIIKENNSRIVPTKIIAILRDDLWNLTCMDNTLGIVRIKLNAISGELQHFDKGGLMDFMGARKG